MSDGRLVAVTVRSPRVRDQVVDDMPERLHEASRR